MYSIPLSFCAFLSDHISLMTISFFQLLTRVPQVTVKVLAPTSVSLTSTRPSPVPALTSWSCSRTNALAKVRTDTVKNTGPYRLFLSPFKKHSNQRCHTKSLSSLQESFLMTARAATMRSAPKLDISVISCHLFWQKIWLRLLHGILSLSFPFHFI